MGWITDIFTGGSGSVIESIGDVAAKFITTDKDRQKFQIALESLLQKRDSEIEQTLRATLGAKERMLVAELQQGDNFTKRARPTVIYSGLAFIGINYVLIPGIERIIYAIQGASIKIAPLADLPPEFWYAWGGICTTWVIGRTMERRGVRNKLTRAITGTQTPSLLDD